MVLNSLKLIATSRQFWIIRCASWRDRDRFQHIRVSFITYVHVAPLIASELQ